MHAPNATTKISGILLCVISVVINPTRAFLTGTFAYRAATATTATTAATSTTATSTTTDVFETSRLLSHVKTKSESPATTTRRPSFYGTTLAHYATRSRGMPIMAAGSSGDSPKQAATWPPSDRLDEYVDESQLVDYNKLAKEETEWLAPVIRAMKATDPRQMKVAERHAFLVNAYNLWTLHYVVKERKSSRRWKGAVSSFAKIRFFYWHKIVTGAGTRNLYDFENKDIRPDVDDARVHFALNCASMSCPPLRRTLFTAAGFDEELDEVTSAAINGGAFVQLTGDGKLLVNPIFKWYKEDFDKEGGTLAFIRKHWKGATPLPAADIPIEFFEYDWRTNSADSEWRDRPLGGPAP